MKQRHHLWIGFANRTVACWKCGDVLEKEPFANEYATCQKSPVTEEEVKSSLRVDCGFCGIKLKEFVTHSGQVNTVCRNCDEIEHHTIQPGSVKRWIGDALFGALLPPVPKKRPSQISAAEEVEELKNVLNILNKIKQFQQREEFYGAEPSVYRAKAFIERLIQKYD